VFQVAKLIVNGKKTFRQAHLTGQGWLKGGPKQTCLYRQQRLAAAKKSSSALVWLVEGEKDVHSLEGLGLVATTAPGGAGKWHDHYSESLDGLEVALIPDNDDVGRKGAVRVANKLTGRAGDVRVLDLLAIEPGAWPRGSDVTDWIDRRTAEGWSREDMRHHLLRSAGKCANWRPKGSWRIALWSNGLALTAGDEPKPKNCLANIIHCLSHPSMRDVVGYDDRASRVTVRKLPPWRSPDDDGCTYPRATSDRDLVACAAWVESYGVKANPSTLAKQLELVACRYRYDPVKDWLGGLEWDGVLRLDTVLIDYMGAADTAYTRAVWRAWCISAVARAYEPGCKVDSMIVLDGGGQGSGKSTLLRELCGSEWYLDSLPPLHGGDKDALMSIQGMWIIEADELASFRKAEAAQVKSFATRRKDRYRAPWATYAEDHPRRCVLAGTVNDSQYLRDDTGNRRFWPISVRKMYDLPDLIDAIRHHRSQIWAEATAAYRSGEHWHLNEDIEQMACAQQEERRAIDPWEEVLEEFLLTHHETTVKACLAHVVDDESRRSHANRIRVVSCLKQLGWVQSRSAGRRVYVKP
jgi:predicted P-loop ATPase